MRDLNKTIRIFLADFPDASYEEFVEAFGPPDYMAQVMLLCEQQAADNSAWDRSWKAKRRCAAACTAAMGLLICTTVEMLNGMQAQNIPSAQPKDIALLEQSAGYPQSLCGLVVDMRTDRVLSVSIYRAQDRWIECEIKS